MSTLTSVILIVGYIIGMALVNKLLGYANPSWAFEDTRFVNGVGTVVWPLSLAIYIIVMFFKFFGHIAEYNAFDKDSWEDFFKF